MARRPSFNDVRPVRELVTLDEAWEARVYIDDGRAIDAYGEAYAEVRFREYMLRRVEGILAKDADQPSNEKRLWEARASEQYLEAVQALRKAEARHEKLKATRAGKFALIELYRTLQADKRAREAVADGSGHPSERRSR